MAKSPAVQIVNDAEVPAEVLASSIVTTAEGVRKLRAAKLGGRALFLLIQDACPERIGLDKIRMIFDAAGELDKRYIRKPK